MQNWFPHGQLVQVSEASEQSSEVLILTTCDCMHLSIRSIYDTDIFASLALLQSAVAFANHGLLDSHRHAKAALHIVQVVRWHVGHVPMSP